MRGTSMGRLETPPEFKDWASNTLPTPGISNGHQTMTEGRGTSEHETSQLSPLLSEGQRTPVVFPRAKKGSKGASSVITFHVFVGKFPPPGACLRIYEDRSRRPNRSTNRTPNRELKSHGLWAKRALFSGISSPEIEHDSALAHRTPRLSPGG